MKSIDVIMGTTVSAIALVASTHAYAQETIQNTADITYVDAAGNSRGGRSNTVNTQVFDIRTPPTVRFYVAGPGGEDVLVSGGCGIVAPSVESLVPTEAAAPGVDVYVMVEDIFANRDPNTNEDIMVDVQSGSETVSLKLVETGPNTGKFAGILRTTLSGDDADECTLPIDSSGSITGSYNNGIVPVTTPSLAVTPYNVVFDSATLRELNGAKITIVDASTGAPARVLGVDGGSTFPSTVIVGRQYQDSAGRTYAIPDGGFTFPVLPTGKYRLEIEPNDGYNFPSATSPEDYSSKPVIQRKAINIKADASYGNAFDAADRSVFNADIPLDKIGGSVVVTKSVSTDRASPGDYIQYQVTVQNTGNDGSLFQPTMTDIMPKGIRYQKGSFHLNGQKIADPTVQSDGRTMSTILPALDAGSSYTLTYVGSVTSNAPIGDAINEVSVRAGGVTSPIAKAGVRIEGGLFSDAVTIIGRIVTGSCLPNSPDAIPVPGVRVLLEDGTYVVTDLNGQYHIENVRPGLHVAQMDRNSIPDGYTASECADNTRRAGSGMSQFVDARGGALWRADFFLKKEEGANHEAAPVGKSITTIPERREFEILSPNSSAQQFPETTLTAPVLGESEAVADATALEEQPALPTISEDSKSDDSISAAGGNTDWSLKANGSSDILFPAPDYNPRSPSTRVVVAHGMKDKVSILLNGEPVNPLLFDGSSANPSETGRVAIWSGLPLENGENLLEAMIEKEDGSVLRLERVIAYVNQAHSAEIVDEQSVLIADGQTKPVIAVRLTDRRGRPVRSGVSGRLDLSSPYVTAASVQNRRDSQLIQQTASSSATWTVTGDDGIALIELAPTTQTGEIRLDLHLREDRNASGANNTLGSVIDRRDELVTWLSPGDQEWVVVGFAAGSTGYTTIARQAETLSENPGDTSITDGQVKLYAKGRVKGKWLLTLAYDSDKESDRQRRQSILTNVDPEAYYTLYGDEALQGYDAQSTENIYLKLETKQFYALFGDFTTGIVDTELGQYQRVLTGFKSQYQTQETSVTAFAANTPFRHERDEIQGEGLTGPYQLDRRDIVLNTERVRIEVRDRLRPEIILDSRTLERFIDYEIDYARGIVKLRQPLLSRDADLNPNFLVVDYETYGTSEERLVAGVRATQELNNNLTIGATVIHTDDEEATNMGVVDANIRVDDNTTVRAEVGLSEGGDRNGHAYIVEATRIEQDYDARAYIREQSRNYGVGQQNAVDAGYRKIGVDGTVRVGRETFISATAFDLNDLSSIASRQAIRGEVRTSLDPKTTVTTTAQYIRQTDSLGDTISTAQVGGALTRSFLNDRLLVTGEASVSIDGNDTVSTPSRYRIGAAYSVTDSIRLLADHEIATGSGITGNNTRLGIEAEPWRGATVSTSWNQQAISENGERTYGAFGARQNFRLSPKWSADVSLDSQRTIDGGISADVVNPLNPPANGGRLDQGLPDYDYTSISAGLAYQGEKTSWTGRAEGRLGDNRRYGVSTSLVKQLEEGKVWGGSATAYRLNEFNGGRVDHADAALAIALRKPDSRIQILDKLEAVYDRIDLGATVPGLPGNAVTPISNTAINVLERDVLGPVAPTSRSASSMRFINNFSLNWIASGSEEEGSRTQVSFYHGAKYTIQNFDGVDYGGFYQMASVEARHDLTDWLDFGLQAGVKHSWSDKTLQWSLGPTVGVSPIKNTWVSFGYNVTGFEDRDFAGARGTVKGPWLSFRIKFDETSLGLAGRK